MMRQCCCYALLAIAMASGCDWSKEAPASNADSNRAREILLDVLETWRQGKVGTLAKRQPPVRFVDDDFVEGGKLLEYHLVDPDKVIAPYDSVPVVIKVKNGSRVIERTTVYQVTLEPKIAVLRAE